jgi:hypothetical protein
MAFFFSHIRLVRESARPLDNDSLGHPFVNHTSEPFTANREKLRPVVPDAVFGGTGCETPADLSALVEDGHLNSLRSQGPGGQQTREACTND